MSKSPHCVDDQLLESGGAYDLVESLSAHLLFAVAEQSMCELQDNGCNAPQLNTRCNSACACWHIIGDQNI